jgi:hypothetical protein
MSSTNPPPDYNTMESLVNANETLQQALNQHRRALLNARKHMGLGSEQDRSAEPSLTH